MLRQGAAFWFVVLIGLLTAALIIGGGFYIAVQQGAVELGSAPDMEVTMSAAPSTVAAGESVTYTANYTNKGENPAGSVSLTVTLPQGITIGEIVPAAACTASGSTVVCRLGTQNPGRQGSVDVTATVASSATKGTEFEAGVEIKTATTRDVKKAEAVTDNNSASATVTVQ